MTSFNVAMAEFSDAIQHAERVDRELAADADAVFKQMANKDISPDEALDWLHNEFAPQLAQAEAGGRP